MTIFITKQLNSLIDMLKDDCDYCLSYNWLMCDFVLTFMYCVAHLSLGVVYCHIVMGSVGLSSATYPAFS